MRPPSLGPPGADSPNRSPVAITGAADSGSGSRCPTAPGLDPGQSSRSGSRRSGYWGPAHDHPPGYRSSAPSRRSAWRHARNRVTLCNWRWSARSAQVAAVMRALAVGCGYRSGRPDPDILSHREPCWWGGASLAAGEPLPDSGTLALAMLLMPSARGRADPCSRRLRPSGLLPVRLDLGNLDVRCLHRR